jgi:hypothetical protein
MLRALPAFALIAVASLAGCTRSASPSEASEQAPPESSPAAPTTPAAVEARTKGAVIATIATRDAKVSIVSGRHDELRVILRRTDGTLVADGISLDELRAMDPTLDAIVTSAVASRGAYVDATLHREAPSHGAPHVHGGLGL